MKTEFYKMKHVPTGLYYQPHKHRGSHLSKSGKIYQTEANGIDKIKKYSEKYVTVCCEKESQIYKITKNILTWVESTWNRNQLFASTKHEDWVKEFI